MPAARGGHTYAAGRAIIRELNTSSTVIGPEDGPPGSTAQEAGHEFMIFHSRWTTESRRQYSYFRP